MSDLRGKSIFLRALEPEDLEFLYRLENDPEIWEISGTQKPYSKSTLKKYLKNTHLDIYEIKQLRLCICKIESGELIGLIDLFDFDPRNRRAGVGLVIAEKMNRNQGLGRDALSVLCAYAFGHLNLHQLYANILEDNLPSIHLFEQEGFKLVGSKKDWIRTGTGFKNEVLFQKINRG